MQLNIVLPDQVFERPMLQADITIPSTATNPHPLDAEVVDNVERAIRETTNLDFRVRVVDYVDERDEGNND